MDFDFKKVRDPIYTSDLYYDLFLGGYIKPEKILVCEEQAQEVREAMQIVSDFLDQAEEAGAIEAD